MTAEDRAVDGGATETAEDRTAAGRGATGRGGLARLLRPGGHRWFAAATLTATFATFSVGTVGLVAAIAGAARPAIVLPAAAVLTVALLALWGPLRHADADLDRRVPLLALVLAALVIGGSGLANARSNGQYVRTDRDPGIYTAGGIWIAEHGDLFVDGRTDGLERSPALTGVVSGQWPIDGDDTRLEIQGQHLFPVLLASGDWVGGQRAMQAVPAAIGAVALALFFLLALRFVPWWLALTGLVALAGNFVFLYGVRSTLSEPTSLLFATAGLWLLVEARRIGTPAAHAVAGAMAAATLCTRVDGGVAIAGLPIALAVGVVAASLAGRATPARRGLVQLASYAAGLLPVAVLARVDLYERSSFYATSQGDKIRLVEAGLAAATVLTVAVLGVGHLLRRGGLTRARTVVRERSGALVALVAAAVVGAFAFLWWVRPLLGPVRSPMSEGGLPTMKAIQAKEGMVPDPTRSFDELAVDRLSWYVGAAAVALAVVGFAVLVERALRRRDGDRSLLLLAAVLPTTLLYLWRPSIFPDQPWMMRRYLPVTIPGLLLAALVGVHALVAGARRLAPDARVARWVGPAGGVAAAILLVGPPLRVTVPLQSARWQAGGFHGMSLVCDAVGPDAAVVLSNAQATAISLTPSLRAVCDVPAARPTDAPQPGPFPVDQVAADVAEHGRRLWILGPSPESIQALAPDAGPARSVTILDTTVVEPTLFYPPARFTPQQVVVWVAPAVGEP